jgi:hypothetical protein
MTINLKIFARFIVVNLGILYAMLFITGCPTAKIGVDVPIAPVIKGLF